MDLRSLTYPVLLLENIYIFFKEGGGKIAGLQHNFHLRLQGIHLTNKSRTGFRNGPEKVVLTSTLISAAFVRKLKK